MSESTQLEWVYETRVAPSDLTHGVGPVGSAAHAVRQAAHSAQATASSSGSSSSDSPSAARVASALAAAGWVPWALQERHTSRLDVAHDPLGTWTTAVHRRRMAMTQRSEANAGADSDGVRSLGLDSVTTAQPAAASEFVAARALAALQPLLACFHAQGADSVQCTLDLSDAFRKHGDILAPMVDQILAQGPTSAGQSAGHRVPLSREDQLRVVAVGCSYAPSAVAAYFDRVQGSGEARSQGAVEILAAVGSMLRPTVGVVQAMCGALGTFTGSPAQLASNDVWQRYLLVTSALLGRVAGHVHAAPELASQAPDVGTVQDVVQG